MPSPAVAWRIMEGPGTAQNLLQQTPLSAESGRMHSRIRSASVAYTRRAAIVDGRDADAPGDIRARDLQFDVEHGTPGLLPVRHSRRLLPRG